MQRRLTAAGSLAVILILIAQVPLAAQVDTRDRRLPLGPNRPAGEAVAPFLEAWYANPDGTYTLSFGYFNFNTEQTLEIPLGPDNRIEPAEFDGMQPTYFPGPTQREREGDMARMAPGYQRHERGVFTVTVPPEYGQGQDSVVWTLRVNEETHKVTARVGPGREPMQLDYGPRALGSVPPLLSFEEDGETGQHPAGITLDETLTASVDQPLSITVWVTDPSERDEEALGPLYEEVPIGITWFKHQGPAGSEVTFQRQTEPWVGPEEDPEEDVPALHPFQDRVDPEGGPSAVTATFSEPGDYVLRVRADNFEGPDSSASDQCCWTNGYVTVSVTP